MERELVDLDDCCVLCDGKVGPEDTYVVQGSGETALIALCPTCRDDVEREDAD
jgi:hypothetical protein